MLERGFLANRSFYATYAHRDEHVDAYAMAVGEAFEFIAGALSKGTVQEALKGPVAHSGFRRLT
ncbi:hypothetical protein D1872_347300 [compost metagenome]